MTHWWHLRPGEGRFVARIIGIGGPIALLIGALVGIFTADPGPALPGRAVAPTSTSSTTVAPPGTREGSPTLALAPEARVIQATRERAIAPVGRVLARPVEAVVTTSSTPKPAAVARPSRSTTPTPTTMRSVAPSSTSSPPPTTDEGAAPPPETARTPDTPPEHAPKGFED